MAWAPSPRRPFIVQFQADVEATRRLVFRQAKAMPREAVYGPHRQGPSWELARQMGIKAAEACGGSDHLLGKEMLGIAWQYFANTAEQEVAAATDAVLLRSGLRAMAPEAHWVKAANKSRTADEQEAVAEGWRWLLAAARTAERMAQEGGGHAGNRPLAMHCALLSQEAYPGKGLLPRLDHFAGRLRGAMAHMPEEAGQGALPTPEEEGTADPGRAWTEEMAALREELQEEAEQARKARSMEEAAFLEGVGAGGAG